MLHGSKYIFLLMAEIILSKFWQKYHLYCTFLTLTKNFITVSIPKTDTWALVCCIFYKVFYIQKINIKVLFPDFEWRVCWKFWLLCTDLGQTDKNKKSWSRIARTCFYFCRTAKCMINYRIGYFQRWSQDMGHSLMQTWNRLKFWIKDSYVDIYLLMT